VLAFGGRRIATQRWFIRKNINQMRRLSSRMTFFNKRVFPVIWFGFLAFLMASPFIAPLTGGRIQGSPAAFLVGPAFMMVVGYFFMKKLVFDLVDEVLDGGDVLVIRNRGLEERVALSDIMNVSYSPFVNPPRVTLSLRRPSIFGDRVSFGAPVSFVPFSTSAYAPIIDELVRRIDAARRVAR
jgi:hypothetical protein